MFPLCFANFDFGFLAWILLVPLHLAITNTSLKRAFWLGWMTGVIAFVGIMSWVVTAMNLYGKMPLAISYVVMLLLATYLGLYLAGYALALAWLQQRLLPLAFLGAACIWVGLELLRTYLFSGLPWCLLGYSQYRWITAIQIADHTAVYGVSFLIVLVNGAVTEASKWVSQLLQQKQARPIPWIPIGAALAAMSITVTYGHMQLTNSRPVPNNALLGGSQPLAVGLVQPNIDQAHKWDAAYLDQTLSRLRRLTLEAATGSDLVVWPEAATPFLFEREPLYQGAIRRLVESESVPLLFGSPAVRFYPNGHPYLLNSAYLLSPKGLIVDRYDKQHLVPFGEYIPLKSSLLFFLDKFVQGIGDFESGSGPTVMGIPRRDGKGELQFGVVICYEVIFPNLVRAFAKKGVDFMVTITNDAWFGESVAPFQHFSMVVFRAVENRTPFARAANTGVSGLIDSDGRILLHTPIFQELATQGKLHLNRVPTFYSHYGDVFAYSCVIIAGILLAWAFRRPGQDTPAHKL